MTESIYEIFHWLPHTPYEVYESKLERLQEAEKTLAFHVFSWLLHAERPLRLRELLQALFVGQGDKELKTYLNQIIQKNGFQGLVTWDAKSDTVRFIHQTVKLVLDSYRDRLRPIRDIAITCSTYLALDVFGQDYVEDREEKFAFRRYAAEYWAHYTRLAEEDLDVIKAALRLLASENKMNSMLKLEANVTKTSFTNGQTLFHVIAKNGFAKLCTFVIEGSPDVLKMYITVDIRAN